MAILLSALGIVLNVTMRADSAIGTVMIAIGGLFLISGMSLKKWRIVFLWNYT